LPLIKATWWGDESTNEPRCKRRWGIWQRKVNPKTKIKDKGEENFEWIYTNPWNGAKILLNQKWGESQVWLFYMHPNEI
jgi:hypothetical protein